MVIVQHFFPFIFWLFPLKSLSWLFVSFLPVFSCYLNFYVYFCYPKPSFFHPPPLFHFFFYVYFWFFTLSKTVMTFFAIIFKLFKSFIVSLFILWEKHSLLFWLDISVKYFSKKSSKKNVQLIEKFALEFFKK